MSKNLACLLCWQTSVDLQLSLRLLCLCLLVHLRMSQLLQQCLLQSLHLNDVMHPLNLFLLRQHLHHTSYLSL
jgi:hypothetical protein